MFRLPYPAPLILALTFSGLAAVSNAAESADSSPKTYLLRYKYQLGEVLKYRVQHRANVRSTIDETTQEVESITESVKAWKVTDVLPNGEIEFIHVVESAKMSNRRPRQPVAEFDSTKAEKPPAFFAQAAKSIGVPLSQIRMTPAGKIVDREEKHAQPKASDDMPITLRLPDKAIEVGEKWHHVYDVKAERSSGAKIKIRTRRLCELLSVKQGVAAIKVTYQIMTPVEPHIVAQLVERLTAGTVRFDLERGRVLAQEHSVDKRIVGFAGKASSMHFVARLEEHLLGPDEKVAATERSAQRVESIR